jgi:signal transduction histidine kinase
LPLLRSYVREAARALRAPVALGTGVLWTFVAVFALLVALSLVLSDGAPVLPVLIAAAVSTTAAIALMVLARLFLLPRIPARGVPWVVVGIYLAAGLARSLILAGLLSTFGVTLILLPPRVTTFAAFVVMMLATITGNRCIEHQAKMAELADLQRQLAALNEGFTDRVRESNADLTAQVRRYLDPAVQNIHDLLDRPGDASADVVANAMVTAVSEVVRPLTQDLGGSRTESTGTDPTGIETTQRPSGDTFLIRNTRVEVARAIRPVLVLVVLSLTLVYRPIRMPSASINGPFIILVLALFVLLLVARRLVPMRFAVLALPKAIAAITILFLVSAIVPWLVLELISSADLRQAFPFPGASLGFWALVGLAVSVPSLVEQFAEQSETAATKVNLKLSLARARLQRQLWINRRNLTWVLHGPIQSALVSSAMALSQGGDDPILREGVRMNLTAALAQLEETRMAHPDLRLALSDIAAVWSVNCRVSWRIDPLAGLLLDDDRDVVRCVAEIAREGVSNAVRHGSAGRVDIKIDVPDGNSTGVIRVRIIDDGTGLAASASAGLGSAMLDELTLSWSRFSERKCTTLLASVPTRLPVP